MTKRLLNFALSLAMVLTMTPLVAGAEGEVETETLDFRFTRNQPTTETTYAIKDTVGSGTATWTPASGDASNKLTLNNVIINNSTSQLVGVPANTEIVLVGENVLSGFNAVIQSSGGDLKITGDGSLKVVSISSGNDALCTSSSGAVDVNIGGKLEVTGKISSYDSSITLKAGSIEVTGSVQTRYGVTTLTSTTDGVQVTEFVSGKGVSIVSTKDIIIGKTVSTADTSAMISLTAQDGDLTVQKISGDYGKTPVILSASGNLKVLGVASEGVYAGTLSLSGTIPEGTVLEPYVSAVVIPENQTLYNNGKLSIHSRGTAATVTVAGTLHMSENSIIDNGYGTTITPAITGNGVIVAPPASELDFSARTEDSQGTGYTWDYANKTLTLNNYTSETVKGIVLPDGAALVLEGSNTLEVSNSAVIQAKGTLTIRGSGNLRGTTERSISLDAAGAVTITDCILSLTTNQKYGIVISTNGNALTINGSADVSLNCTDSDAGWGINTGSSGNFELGSDVKLTINAPVGILIRSAEVKLNGTLDTTNCSSMCANLLTATLDIGGSSITMKEGTHIWLYQKTNLLTGTDNIKAFNGKLRVATGNDGTVDYYKVKVNDTLALYAVGTSLSFTAADGQAGKNFTSWSATGVTLDNARSKTISFTMPDNEVSLFEVWEVATYTVAFDSDGGTNIDSQTVNYNGKVAEPNTPTKGGYTFSGWYCGEKKFDFNTPITSNVTLTAHWTRNSSSSSSSSSSNAVTTPSKTENGTVSVGAKNAKKGDTVTITVTPDSGYQVGQVTVKDAKGNAVAVKDLGGGKYSFVMPATKVSVEASFVKAAAPETGFIDVAADAWYKDAVNYVAQKGLMSGTGERIFSPEDPMTRAMLMTVLARYAGEDTNGGATWYEKGMAWAMTNGVSDGSAPAGNITREQLVTMLYRYTGSPKTNGSLAAFADAGSVSAYAVQAMQWAVEQGIITGTTPTTIHPQGNATRAQVATILMRFCQGRDA